MYMYIMNIVFIFKNLGDGGLMSQGRAAELPVTTDTNVPFTPATLFFIFVHYLIIYYYHKFMKSNDTVPIND